MILKLENKLFKGSRMISFPYVFSHCAIVGFFSNAQLITAYSLAVEVLGSKHRGWCVSIGMLGTSCGTVGVAVLAYFWRDWHELQIAVAVYTLPAVILVWFVPESWRWMVAAGKLDEAKRAAFDIAVKGRAFGKPVSEKEKKELFEGIDHMAKASDSLNKTQKTVVDLITDNDFRWVTINLNYNWFVNSIVYYGLALNSGALPGSIYTNNIILALMDVPSHFVFPFLIETKRFGRKGTLAWGLILGGICCLLSTVCLEFAGCDENSVLDTIGKLFAYTGKVFIAATFSISYIIAGEIYPAELRSNGIGLCSASARVSGILCPFVLSLAGIFGWLPGVIFSVFGISAGILSFWLPETRGKRLTTSLIEAKRILFGGYDQLE